MVSAHDSSTRPRKGSPLGETPTAIGAKAEASGARETLQVRQAARATSTPELEENRVTVTQPGVGGPKSRTAAERQDVKARDSKVSVALGNTIANAALPRTRAQRGPSKPISAEAVSRAEDRDLSGDDRPSQASSEVSDPPRGAMPENISTRYLRVGDEYHFPDGALAFRDRGQGLSTPLENVEVIRDLIAIAQERGWTEIAVAGTERFRKEAWQQARVAGLDVRGYTPGELGRKQLAHRMGLRAERAHEASKSTAAPLEAQSSPPDIANGAEPLRPSRAPDRVYRGRLLEHGIARYEFDPRKDESYYVLLETGQGEVRLWGKDLARALEASLSHAREDQDVVVRQFGTEPVMVRRPFQDGNGRIVEVSEVKSRRARWSVETREFLEDRAALAEVVRDVSMEAKAAVLKHPELTGTYSDLHVARLVAEHQGYSREGVERFVKRTREALAEEIEKGEALSAPLDPARYRGPSPLPRTHQRIQERVP